MDHLQGVKLHTNTVLSPYQFDSSIVITGIQSSMKFLHYALSCWPFDLETIIGIQSSMKFLHYALSCWPLDLETISSSVV